MNFHEIFFCQCKIVNGNDLIENFINFLLEFLTGSSSCCLPRDGLPAPLQCRQRMADNDEISWALEISKNFLSY